MDLSTWYNNADYSDLTIKLSDGREIRVHRSVLCTANDYFKKACGIRSHFAESKLDVIELKEDDPDAMDYVLQYVYKIPSQPTLSWHGSWSFCLDIYTTADKYLEPELSAEAYHRFVSIARSERSIMQIFNIIETLRRDVDHNEDLVKLAGELQVTHLLELLKYDPFRAYMDNKKESMWEVIDTFATKERDTAEITQDSLSSCVRITRR